MIASAGPGQSASVGRTSSECALAEQLRRFAMHPPAAANPAQQRRSGETLATRCLSVIVANFERIDITSRAAEAIPAHQIAEITAQLPLTLSPLVTAGRVHGEAYWKRASLNAFGWASCRLGEHGMRWKRLFFEKLLQREIEQCDGLPESVARLEELLVAAADFVYTIRLEQLPSHMPVDALFARAHNLTKIDLCYGVNKIGMQYDRALFGMKLPDAVALEKVFRQSACLTTVVLSRSIVDDDLLRLLFVGLERNRSITHLDLSHNKVTDFGVQLLCKLLGEDSVLCSLDLSDNLVFREGGRHLGRALSGNSSLDRLNLRLNRLEDAGCAELLKAMLLNDSLRELNISANLAGDHVRTYHHPFDRRPSDCA